MKVVNGIKQNKILFALTTILALFLANQLLFLTYEKAAIFSKKKSAKRVFELVGGLFGNVFINRSTGSVQGKFSINFR